MYKDRFLFYYRYTMTAIMSSHGSNMNLWYTAAPASLGHLWGRSHEGRRPRDSRAPGASALAACMAGPRGRKLGRLLFSVGIECHRPLVPKIALKVTVEELSGGRPSERLGRVGRGGGVLAGSGQRAPRRAWTPRPCRDLHAQHP